MGNKLNNSAVLIRCIRLHDWTAVHHLVTTRGVDVNGCTPHGVFPLLAAVASCRFGKPSSTQRNRMMTLATPPIHDDDDDGDHDSDHDDGDGKRAETPATTAASNAAILSDAEVAEARRLAATRGDDELTIEEKSQRIVKLLLDHRADVNKRNKRSGQRALHCIFLCDQPITMVCMFLYS
jgi:hypothetical protein